MSPEDETGQDPESGQEVLETSQSARIKPESDEVEMSDLDDAEQSPSIEELQEQANAAQKALSDARLAAAGETAVADDEPRGRSNVSEHGSRVDDMSAENATHQERPLAPWIRPSSLEAPPARDGFVQRWIRISTKGVDDPRNLNQKTREGWQPRPANTIPSTFMMTTGTPGSDEGGHFIVDDLMLCEMPSDIYAQRRAYYEGLSQDQKDAVRKELEEAEVDGHHISQTRRSSVTHPARVVGRQVAAADD